MTKRTFIFLPAVLFFATASAELSQQQQLFVNEQIAILDGIKPLSDAQREQLAVEFEKAETAHMSISFNRAMSTVLSDKIWFSRYYNDKTEKKTVLETPETVAKKICSSRMRLAFENKSTLKLSESQVDSLIVASEKWQNKEKYNKEEDNTAFERKLLLNILSKEQMNDLLALSESAAVNKKVQDALAELKKYNIAAEYDRSLIEKQAYSYFMQLEQIKYMYRSEPDKMKEMIAFQKKQSCPRFLKQLEAEKKKLQKQEENAGDKDKLMF